MVEGDLQNSTSRKIVAKRKELPARAGIKSKYCLSIIKVKNSSGNIIAVIKLVQLARKASTSINKITVRNNDSNILVVIEHIILPERKQKYKNVVRLAKANQFYYSLSLFRWSQIDIKPNTYSTAHLPPALQEKTWSKKHNEAKGKGLKEKFILSRLSYLRSLE